MPNQKEDCITVRDAPPALISRRLFELAHQRCQNNIKSIEQRGCNPEFTNHGKTWNWQRSRFILSGLLRCALCDSRYQGVTRRKSKKRLDGNKVSTYYYGCGGYITKGTSACQMNAIPKDILESTIINTVLDFYGYYLQYGGRQKLAEAIKAQIGAEKQDISAARQ